jgi:uncharacterized protein (DUF305 family)
MEHDMRAVHGILMAIVLTCSIPVLAQESGGHGDHAMPQTDSVADQLAAINSRMHMDMDVQSSGNPDVDFVRAMIPHHQGAIEMAQVILAHGKDPEVRKLADEIVKAQESEIAWMRAYLAKRGY